MSDEVLNSLYRALAEADGPVWWFADEQVVAPLPRAREDVQVFCNRVDTAEALRTAGFVVHLGDFAVEQAPLKPQTVVYRVSKERPLVNMLINAAMTALPIGGRLLLSGYKNDGLKGYADKTAKTFAAERVVRKGDSGAYLAEITKRADSAARLPDKDYRQLRPICEEPLLYSKPGIYGWEKIDRGSRLLISQLPDFVEGLTTPIHRIADLGCGYGYLSVAANEYFPNAQWLLTDNNATALLACEKNMAAHGMVAECVLTDCADGVSGPVDVLLCNPPFHQGFAIEGGLTERFLQGAARLLTPTGQALFVVNQFIPLPRYAEALFGQCKLLCEQDGFRVYGLSAPQV